jgi:hypothetical protein
MEMISGTNVTFSSSDFKKTLEDTINANCEDMLAKETFASYIQDTISTVLNKYLVVIPIPKKFLKIIVSDFIASTDVNLNFGDISINSNIAAWVTSTNKKTGISVQEKILFNVRLS